MSRFRGGQPGNQNARKHGYYSRVLNATQKTDVKRAVAVKGLDNEIALLRSKLKCVADNDPHNIRLISLASNTLARLLKTRQKLAFFERILAQKEQKMR